MSAPRSDDVVQVRGLTKRYGNGVTAVDGIDLTVRRGRGLRLPRAERRRQDDDLRMLPGLVAPSAGSVSVLGRHPGDPAALARTGSLVEGPAFYPYLSGRDNLRVSRGTPGCRPRR